MSKKLIISLFIFSLSIPYMATVLHVFMHSHDHSHETHNSYLSRQGAGIAVSYGLPWEEALKGLTSNITDVFKISKRGSIKPGHIADIVIWSGDPLEVTTFVEEVYIAGKRIPTKSRSMRLKDRFIDN